MFDRSPCSPYDFPINKDEQFYINSSNIEASTDVFCRLIFRSYDQTGTAFKRVVILNKGDFCKIKFFDEKRGTIRNENVFISGISFDKLNRNMDYISFYVMKFLNNPYGVSSFFKQDSLTISTNNLIDLVIVDKAPLEELFDETQMDTVSNISNGGANGMIIGAIADGITSIDISIRFVNTNDDIEEKNVSLSIGSNYTVKYYNANKVLTTITGKLDKIVEVIRPFNAEIGGPEEIIRENYLHTYNAAGRDIKMYFDCVGNTEVDLDTDTLIYLSVVSDITAN